MPLAASPSVNPPIDPIGRINHIPVLVIKLYVIICPIMVGIHQWLSILMNHCQSLSIIFNHYQSLSIIINHYTPTMNDIIILFQGEYGCVWKWGTPWTIHSVHHHISTYLYILIGGFKHVIYGMSSFPLTNSYFSRWLLHHQPVIYHQG